MTEQELLNELKSVQTMPELDALRTDTVEAMEADGSGETFERVQGEFIKAKNRLQRVPLSQRNW